MNTATPLFADMGPILAGRGLIEVASGTRVFLISPKVPMLEVNNLVVSTQNKTPFDRGPDPASYQKEEISLSWPRLHKKCVAAQLIFKGRHTAHTRQMGQD